MGSLYYSPAFLGSQHVTVTGASGKFGLRIDYPSDEEGIWNAPIKPGRYPLVVFAHGARPLVPKICPADITLDYTRWIAVLQLIARCGFVVASPAVHDVVRSSESTAERLEDTVQWMRQQWAGNASLHYPPRFDEALAFSALTPPDESYASGEYPEAQAALFGLGTRPQLVYGWPTPLGLVGHSWGARACALVAVRGKVKVKSLASIAGTFDDNESVSALVAAKDPTLLLCGSVDTESLSYLRGFWPSLVRPKHQAVLQGLDHWDWFGPQGAIRRCNPGSEPSCPVGWQTASELVLGFMTKYLYDQWFRPPYLLGSPGKRPPLLPWYESPSTCALKVRWEDPQASASIGTTGEITLGMWSETSPW